MVELHVPSRDRFRIAGWGLAALLLIAGCGSGSAPTDTDVTSPTTSDSTALVVTTSVPTTVAQAPTTDAPTAEAPATLAPTSAAPTTTSPVLVASTAAWDGAQTSQRATATNQLPVRVYDDFTPDQTDTVTHLSWEGIYCRPVEGATAAEPAAVSFTIEIFDDAGGAPGASLMTATYGIDEVGETLLSESVQDCGTISSTWTYYGYEVAFAEPLEFAAATTYWLSIQASTADFDPFWGWRSAPIVGAASFQTFDGASTSLPEDRVFALVR